MNRIAVIGSTGSIGCSALAVADAHPDRVRIVALAAGENVSRLADQVERFSPSVVAMATGTALSDLDAELRRRRVAHPRIAASGANGLIAAATHADVDTVLFASSGTASLDAVLAAIEAGKRIALANKEILVMAGAIVMERARRRGVDVLPVDSEHNAIHQCLHGRGRAEIKRLILTASGGPFRDHAPDALERVSADAALRHPTWRMGRKITIDSATLMNKGLEVIEAHWLFGVEADRIEVVIHPQSVVHSMVELSDGSIIAQLGVTDMRLPIQYACSYPDRWAAALPSLDLARCGRLDFDEPAHDRFPCLGLAYRALRRATSLPVVLNAANEVAVDAFLDGRLGFMAIPRVIEQALEAHEGSAVETLAAVRRLDSWARQYALSIIEGLRDQASGIRAVAGPSGT
jgi:1-deoxy-D-xylulose-5-phosphate reductoisomerase